MDTTTVPGILITLAVSVVIGLLVCNHYRKARSSLRDRYHTFWPRFFAPTIDFVVLWPLVGVCQLLLLGDLSPALTAVLSLITATAFHVYTIIFHGRYGRTIGKMACKVKVLRASTGEDISFTIALVRDVIPLLFAIYIFILNSDALTASREEAQELFRDNFWLNMIPLFWFLAEVITMLTNDKRRALHDFIAGTVVVRTNTG